jgi:tetratricopeptide (TPR) repeat protein
MRLTSHFAQTANTTANDAALVRCRTALELKDRGDFEGAIKTMKPLWKGVGTPPELDGLHHSVAAEFLLCIGILTGWIGSKEGIQNAQEEAKNLICESINFYETAGDGRQVAAARAELAYCYWREGALCEARILFNESLEKLTTPGNTRARALLRLSIVEWSDSRFEEALKILVENGSLFGKITNHATRGAYHSQMAMILRSLAPPQKSTDYIKRILKEYEQADHHFKLAHNVVFRADVKNNIGNIFRELSRFKESHRCLEQARRLRATVRDKIGVAQIDDTRAQVFIAEKKFKEAEAVARNAVRNLEKSGHQCLLTDALITHGVSLARLKRAEPAQFAFQKAIEVAHQVGALNKAGIAALTMIEELEELSADALYAAYDRASEWLAKSQSQDLLLRLNAAARKVFASLRDHRNDSGATMVADPIEAILNKPCDLQSEILKFEGSVIKRALAKANGSLTRAAALLSMSYQALAYILESRQKDLLNERTPIRRRSRRDTATAAPAEAEQA